MAGEGLIDSRYNYNLWRRGVAGAAALVSYMALFGPAVVVSPAGADARRTEASCTQFGNPFNPNYNPSKLRACTAYLVNAVEGSLEPYYERGLSMVSYLRDQATHHFRSRYFPPLRDKIQAEVKSWEEDRGVSGTNDVRQEVEFLGISVNTNARRSIVTTREEWFVYSNDGQILHKEPPHVVRHTMCKAGQPGYPTDSWLVIADRALPNFNCVKYAIGVKNGEIR